LKNSSLSEEQHEQIKAIDQSTKTLSYLINDLLELSKIDAREVKVNPVDFDIVELIENNIHAFHQMADEKGLHLDYNIDSTVPRAVKADKLRINQVLNNLISNAIKFTHKGQVNMSVKQKSNGDKDNSFWLLFEVADTGIGIKQSQKEKLFQRFSQIDASLTRKYEGTGLGLAICRELVELMDGDIGVNTTYGEGSTFWFKVKVQEAEQVIPSSTDYQQQASQLQESALEPFNALLIEDNLINQKVTEAMLEKLGGVVTLANNGQEGIDLIKDSKDYDLIFLDIQMPDIDGLQVASKLKHIAPSIIDRVVIITAKALQGEDRQEIVDLGIKEIIMKPIQLRSLSRLLQKKVSTTQTKKNNNSSIKTNTKSNKSNKMYKRSQLEEKLKYLRSLVGAEADSLMEDFLTNSETYIEQIEEAQQAFPQEKEKESLIQLKKALHSLAGSAGSMGFAEFAQQARSIEQQIEQDLKTDISASSKNVKKSEYYHQEVKLLKQEFLHLKRLMNDKVRD
jgi:CheY-like chemotaxis protein/HPt (histidine-containing phosphotransfer) domain-containing protein/two-component sensor histidine kinase